MSFLSLKDLNLHYETTGNGEPILFLHGLGSSGLDWEPQYKELEKKYKCILPDLRGHGKTDKPNGSYSIAGMANDVIELIESLHFTSVHLVGISMGGAVAFQIAHTRPKLVKSMVIINSVSDWRMKTIGERFKLGQRKLIVRLMGMRKMGEVLARRLFPKPKHNLIRQDFIEKWATNDTSAYLKSLNALVDWFLSANDLKQMNMQTLFLVSDLDYSPIAKKEKIASLIPNAKVEIIEDARHAVTVEYPEIVNKHLLAFFNQY